MGGRAWAIAIATLMVSVALAGCAAPERSPDGETSSGDRSDRLGLRPVAPESTEVAVEPGETVTFVAECEPPGLPEEVVVEWEHAIRGEGVEDRHQDFQSSDESSAFAVTFESSTDQIVTAVCTTADDRTPAHVWNVTVQETETDQPPTENTTNGTDGGGDAQDTETNDTTDAGPDGNLTVHFVDVGQGDGIVLHFPRLGSVVVDTGRWSGSSETAVLEHLQAEDVDPSGLLITHPDADHAGGCDELLDAFVIEVLYHPGIDKDTQTWDDCKQAMWAEDSRIYTDAELDPGDELNWSAAATVQLLHVDASRTDDPNEGSMALGITYGAFEMVLTGDIGCESEEAILERGLVGDVDVLQVGHHGSRFSTCDTWLDAIRPEAGVISVGANSYGHPTDEVLDRLAGHGVDVFRTDTHGAVEVTTNGTTWDIRPERTGETTDTDGSTSDEGSTDDPSGVRIGEIHADAEGNDHENLNDEWVEIVNDGNESVELSGWTLSDEADHTYTFPSGFTLDPGASVTVHTGDGTDTATDLYWGSGSAVWNNGGDTAFLHDGSGNLADSSSW